MGLGLEPRLTIASKAVILGFWLLLLASNALGEKPAFVLVKTRGSTIYDQVEKHLVRQLEEQGIVQLDLEDPIALRQRILEEAPQVVITLGTRATKVVANLNIPQPVVFSTVLTGRESLRLSRAARERRLYGIELFFSPETLLFWIKKLFPRTRTIGLMCFERCPRVKALSQKAPDFDLKVVLVELKSPRELNQSLWTLAQQADLIVALPDYRLYNPATIPRIILFSIEHALPLVGISRNYAGAGAVLALDWDWQDLATQTAELSRRILAGDRPQKAIHPPRKARPIINIRTARLIGLHLPQKILNQSTIIE